MPLIGPQGATALAAGFNGQDLAAQLLQKQLQNRTTQMELQEARRQQLGRLLLEDSLKRVMGASGEMPMPKAPAKTTRAGEIKVEPVAPPNAEGTTMPGAGGAPVTAPAGGGIAPAGAPAASPPGSGTQPGTPEPAQRPSQGRKPWTWTEVLEDVMGRDDVEPGAKLYARQEIQKQIDAEETRTSRLEEKRMAEEARMYRELEVIKTRYEMAGTNEAEKLRLKSQYDLKLEQLRGLNRENTARIGAESAERRAEMQQTGLQARFQASQANAMERFRMADETRRRGQDFLAQDRELARQGKLDEKRGKALMAVDAAKNNMDDLASKAQALLEMPGLEGAVGPIDAWLPQVFQDKDARAAIAAIESISANAALATLQQIRANSPTGGALGNVSDADIRLLRDATAPLSRWQDAADFKVALQKIVEAARGSKQRLDDAYKQQYGVPMASPDSPAVTNAEPVPEDASKRVVGKSYKSPDGKIGIWTGKGWQPVPVTPQ